MLGQVKVCCISLHPVSLRITDSPHDIPLDGVAVLVPTRYGQTISRLTEVRESMRTNFEFGLVDRRISMSGSFEDTKLSTINGVGAVDVER